MRLTAHRKVPNRGLERQERVWEIVRARLGTGVICATCGARYVDYDEKCIADLGTGCPGANAVERVRVRASKEVGLT